ncbi:hypothetical protein F2B00_09755 [Streptomyces parvus]|uniref:hypothetical protein n=1 Tax=Streptomyces parvus TaxID=66428 RepID=UPI0012399DE9|nr:hypothetical protein [Streptomyces parvus]KAA6202466.1 hypothetical protein F2B00_09755 [Streptomyces parvus]GGS49207.1 hypothetical protein GCM10010221_55330 [Streptomyces parvus]
MTTQSPGVIPVVETVTDAPWLNCDNAHLAALQQFYGVSEPSAAMGLQWSFELRTTDEVPVTLRVPVLDSIARETGLVFERRQLPLPGYYDDVAALVAEGTPLIVYGDAFHMPWLPYFGNDSSAHPTILAGVTDDAFHIVETYTNSTPWGRVVPGPARVPRPEFEKLVAALGPGQRGEVLFLVSRVPANPTDPADALRANAEAVLRQVGERGDMATYAQWARDNATDPEAMGRYDLGCWEVTRARSCHSVWLGRLAGTRPDLLPADLAQRFHEEIDLPWRRASQFAFVNSQRVAKGAKPSTASFDLVAGRLADAETAFARDLLTHLDAKGAV